MNKSSNDSDDFPGDVEGTFVMNKISNAVKRLSCFKRKTIEPGNKCEVIPNHNYDPIEELTSPLVVVSEGLDHKPEICALLSEFPSSDPQDTVLHVVFRKSYSEEFIVNYLLKSGYFHSQLSKVNSDLHLPLHIAVQNEGVFGDKVFDTLLDMQPQGVMEPNIDGSLPIHLACAAKIPSIHAIRRLVSAYPQSLRKHSNIRYRYRPLTEQYVEEKNESIKEELETEGSAPRTWYGLFTNTHTSVRNVRDSSFVSCRDIAAEEGYESNFTPLHIAVFSHAPAEAVECLILEDKGILKFKTSKGRTALDCAESLVVNETLSDDSIETVKNSFAAFEIIQSNQKTSIKVNKLEQTASDMTQVWKSIASSPTSNSTKPFDAAAEWKKLNLGIKFASHILREISALGPKVEKDSNAVVCPEGFKLPPALKHVTIDIELPIGFFRVRHALCKSKSPFFEKEYHMNKMKEIEVKIEAWDRFDDHIGSNNLPKDIDEKDFIGAIRKSQFVMPKSMLVSANTAYQTSSIIEYNDYCFGFKTITKNPEVPFGSTFEAHTQLIFVNGGEYKTRMVCSMKPVFPGSKPLVAWKIRNAMFTGCSDADVALGEVICEHSGN